MSITIKQASVDDSAFLASMILQSSRASKKDGIFDLIFKAEDDEVLLEKLKMLTTTQAKSYCHYKNFLIAQIDGKSVGTLCSYEPRISNKDTLVKALLEIGCEEESFGEIIEIVYGCNFEIKKNTLMFDFMEELDDFIDVGVLKALMQKSLLSARLKGYTKAQTIIEIGSLESELFYKKLGFSVLNKMECERYKELFGRVGLMLMEIEF